VALGDSYTIGTGLTDEAQNFPSLLAKRLGDEIGIDVALVNLGVNGYTTSDLIREELPVVRGLRPELVTILIGANDVVQGSDDATYRMRLAEIYDGVAQLGAAANRVLAVSIPDFSALPGAAPFGAASELRARIEAFNGVVQSEAASRGFGYVDITSISREDNTRHDWLASDNLHPGPAQHQAIADHVWGAAQSRWGPVQWTRWSNSAKQVLTLAQDEAARPRHSYIGTEHLFLGLLKERDGVVRWLLKRRGVTYRRVRPTIYQVLGRRGRIVINAPNIIPTSRVRKVLRIAAHEAQSDGADSVGPEHILLAIISEGEGIAAHMLSDMGVTLAGTRAQLHQVGHPDAATYDGVAKRGWAAAIGQWLDRIRRGPRSP
jgi:lysophospholipase L1-like esterase